MSFQASTIFTVGKRLLPAPATAITSPVLTLTIFLFLKVVYWCLGLKDRDDDTPLEMGLNSKNRFSTFSKQAISLLQNVAIGIVVALLPHLSCLGVNDVSKVFDAIIRHYSCPTSDKYDFSYESEIINAVIYAPIFEEIFFRSYIFDLFKKLTIACLHKQQIPIYDHIQKEKQIQDRAVAQNSQTNRGVSVAYIENCVAFQTGLMFSVAHAPKSLAPFIVRLGLGFAASKLERRYSIVSSIAAHMTWNAVVRASEALHVSNRP